MDAIPLAPRPQLAHYKKLAKELLAACQSEDALLAWTARWLESLARLGVDSDAAPVVERARKARPQTLASAQRLLAQLHGFETWPKFAEHVQALSQAAAASRYEVAADAVVDGDLDKLVALLRDDPALVRAVSSRRHHATLLHYVAANGVEGFRQRTPPNIVAVARTLLDAGAEVDAPNDDYGGGGTALGLVATSTPPARAGVQIALMELLVGAGAAIDGLPGAWQPLAAALANGCPQAAAWLADHGAGIGFVSAAGLGRLDLVKDGLQGEALAQSQIEHAFRLACTYGRAPIVELLLDRGVDVAASDGQTVLHRAVHSGDLATVRLLLARHAPLEAENAYGGTVLAQTLWSAVNGDPEVDYLPIVETVIAAGARVDPEWSTGIERIDAVLRGAVR